MCLVGRGAGKSTLLKILGKEIPLDDGRVVYEQDLIVARLQQDPPRNIGGSVFDFVAEGVAEQAEHLKAYHAISHGGERSEREKHGAHGANHGDPRPRGLWQLDSRISEVLLQLGLNGDAELSSLSGGWLRKAALGRALVSSPRVLLDEPTNHTDIETIDWLEGFLKEFDGSIVFISHDRSFIRNMATRIVDLDRGKLVSGRATTICICRAKRSAAGGRAAKRRVRSQAGAGRGLDPSGHQSARTRNEGACALKALRVERSQRREVMGTAKMQVEEATRSGKIVFELEDVNYQVGEKCWCAVSPPVQRGDKIALVGPNGCGKTTLLKLMLGQLKADSGRVHCGTKLEVAYFDQHRADLDPAHGDGQRRKASRK